MSRLKLFGEGQPGGGTTDHSALANLGYAQSGHTGFVPSQGEALIEILRLTQNTIRDSGGNDRITLSPTSPHITLADQVQVGTRLGLGAAPSPNTGFLCSPSIQANSTIRLIHCNPDLVLTAGSGAIYSILGMVAAQVYAGAIAPTMAGLYFTAYAAGDGTVQKLYGVWARCGLQAYEGPAPQMWGAFIERPWLLAATYPSDVVGMEIQDMGFYPSSSHNAIGLKIADQTAVTGNKYLVEAGPSTPYLRLLGGGNPPADKSNLYLKFGSTLYRVIKSGNYMALEAA
jgi:hypothetical protein